MTSFGSSLSNNAQTRLLNERIDSLEKHFLDIYNAMSSYTRKIARTRDEGDILASQMIQFAESEKINNSMRSCVMELADDISLLQDNRHAEVQRLEAKVINEISLYGDLIRKAKEELKAHNSARNKFMNQTKDQMRVPMGNDVSGVHRAFEMHIEQFESKKLTDIKKILLDFAKIELLYHVKGVEILSRAYKHILAMDEHSDLKEFNSFFNFSTVSSNSTLSRMKSPSHSSLNTDQTLGATSSLKRFNSTPTIPMSNPKSLNKDSNKDDSDEEDNEYNDDDSSDFEEHNETEAKVKKNYRKNE